MLPGVDKVVEMGVADPDRLGLTGHSFGGYNTIAMLTRTTRFQAAMMSAGIADPIGHYGEMANDGTAYGMFVIEHGQFLVYGTPWEKRSYYLEKSPSSISTGCRRRCSSPTAAPTMAWRRSWPTRYSWGCGALGIEVVYAKHEGESHHQAQRSFANQLDYWKRTIPSSTNTSRHRPRTSMSRTTKNSFAACSRS